MRTVAIDEAEGSSRGQHEGSAGTKEHAEERPQQLEIAESESAGLTALMAEVDTAESAAAGGVQQLSAEVWATMGRRARLNFLYSHKTGMRKQGTK